MVFSKTTTIIFYKNSPCAYPYVYTYTIYQHNFLNIIKFAKIVGLVLLVFNAANSVPVKEEQEVDVEEMLFSNVIDDNMMEDNTSTRTF